MLASPITTQHPTPNTQLVDRFGRLHTYLRISITDRCNLRCRYCRPPGFVRKGRAEILSFEEIVRLAVLLVAMGIRKIRLTGGEPTVRSGVEQLVARLAVLPGLETLGLTTNGVFLREKAPLLAAAGLSPTALNVSLDTLRAARFREIAGEDRLPDVLEGIEVALAAGFFPLKINVVVRGGVNEDELCDFVELTRTRPLHVRFIEYMPFSGNAWEAGASLLQSQMLRRFRERYPLVEISASGVAREFESAGLRGRIGFISPLSAPFCRRCTRLRLTAEGGLKSCLFQPAEVSLRALLRSGASDRELAAAALAALAAKPRRHPPAHELACAQGRSMIEIGG